MMLRLLRVLLVVKMLKGFPELQVGDWYGDWKVIGIVIGMVYSSGVFEWCNRAVPLAVFLISSSLTRKCCGGCRRSNGSLTAL